MKAVATLTPLSSSTTSTAVTAVVTLATVEVLIEAAPPAEEKIAIPLAAARWGRGSNSNKVVAEAPAAV